MNSNQVKDVAVAVQFAANLFTEIGPDKLSEVVSRNKAQSNPRICHTHDFCDSNMVMDQAFKDAKVRTSAGRWYRSWELAKRNHFYSAVLFRSETGDTYPLIEVLEANDFTKDLNVAQRDELMNAEIGKTLTYGGGASPIRTLTRIA